MLSETIVDETIKVTHQTSAQRDEFVEMGIGGGITCMILDLRFELLNRLLKSYEELMTPSQKAKARRRSKQYLMANKKIQDLSTKSPLFNMVINHFKHHLSRDGQLRHADPNGCYFCKARIKNKENGIEYQAPINFASILDNCQLQEREVTADDGLEDVCHYSSEGTKQSIEGIVNSVEGTSCVLVPKTWMGKKVRIIKLPGMD